MIEQGPFFKSLQRPHQRVSKKGKGFKAGKGDAWRKGVKGLSSGGLKDAPLWEGVEKEQAKTKKHSYQSALDLTRNDVKVAEHWITSIDDDIKTMQERRAKWQTKLNALQKEAQGWEQKLHEATL